VHVCTSFFRRRERPKRLIGSALPPSLPSPPSFSLSAPEKIAYSSNRSIQKERERMRGRRGKGKKELEPLLGRSRGSLCVRM
jgi:hypothetical protein